MTRVRSQGRQEEVGGPLVLKNEYDLGGCCARKCLSPQNSYVVMLTPKGNGIGGPAGFVRCLNH